MSWAAANAPKVRRETRELQGTTDSQRRSTETVEAALSRLSKAYTTSMECIGMLHKTDRMLQKDRTSITPEAKAMMERVATAARQTLEKAILLDPLVIPHIPSLHRTMRELYNRHGDRWGMVEEPRPIPPVLSSAAHKTTIRELAYLALVNYSDLLQSCSGERQASNPGTTTSLLDRGVIEKLASLEPQGCWSAEPHEDVQRLAVTALCDASSLDGSDPTLWLKLACASRGLENLLELSIVGRSKHRRLQRYALEQGHRALPQHMPPNRAIHRALEELLDEPEPEEYESHAIVEGPIKIILDLPRYSWSMLGRMLLRAAREGADYQVDFRHGRNKEIQFGSPMISMNLSPMLVLPTSVLGRVCLFLDNGSIWRFEATCRALSVAIMSARAVLEEEANMDVKNSDTSIPSPARVVIEKKPIKEIEKKIDPRKSKESENTSKAENHRSSQRLRSQQITSGKKAERLGKRQSFEYCFLAATAGTTVDQHKAAVQEASSDESIRRLLVSSEHGRSTSNRRLFLASDSTSKRREAQYSIGDSSLAAFVELWSNMNSGPIDLIMKYLTHIAMNVEDVFASDPGGTVVLTTCILSCYEARLKRSGFQDQLAPQFYESPTKVGFKRSVETFALDLLHGELLLKQCDRYSPLHVSYDDDCNLITLMVPNLFEACNELQKQLEEKDVDLSENIKKQFSSLKIRCHWLLAVYFLWRSRITQIVSEAQEAEEEGIAFIEEALNSFQTPFVRKDQVILTPHLVSPGRIEQHWKEISQVSLTKYRDEIQASAVVSVAREKFQDLIAVVTRRDADTQTPNEVFDDDARAFAEIGVTLFDRYKSPYGSSDAKHSELVDDFLSVHGNDIILKDGDVAEESEGPIAKMVPLEPISVPSLQEFSNPSILSMLLVCMNMRPENQHHVLHLLLCLVFATKDIHEALLQQLNDAKATRRGDIDDDVSDSDDDSMMSESSGDRNASTKNMDEKRAIQCGHFVAILVTRIRHCFTKILSKDEQQRFIVEHSEKLVRCTLDLSSRWFDSTAKHFSTEDMADLSILQSVSALLADLRDIASPMERKVIDKYHLVSLVQTMIRHRQSLAGLVQNPGDRSTRITKQKLCVKRTRYLTAIATDIGLLLSQHLGKIESLTILKSEILIDSVDGSANTSNNHCLNLSEWRYFMDSILWLWTYSSQNLSENPNAGSGAAICSSFDRPIIASLRVPVATAVIGLCGAGASSRLRNGTPGEKVEDPLSLIEFYDSDASVNDIMSDDEGPSGENSKQKELLRVVCHAVQCVGLVLDKIDDKGALSVSGTRKSGVLGPAFPLVASRVLNHFADTLLSHIADEDQGAPDLWAVEYPSATRTIGEIVDTNLHKVYRWLYGFVLVGEKAHLQLTGKDLASAPAPILDLAVKDSKLENVWAAAQLYRCITRAYYGSRRSPPKKALELVWDALPPFDESEKSKGLRSFVFDSKDSYFSHEQLVRLVGKEEGWNSPFAFVDRHLLTSAGEDHTTQLLSEEFDVAMRVRRGILSELAGGQLPLTANENSKGKSDQTIDDDRLVAIKNEEEIAKKFGAIVDDLCLGNSENTEGWYRAAQCLNTKAELIADRLGLSRGFARSTDFATPLPLSRSVQGIELERLTKEQDDEDAAINANWLYYLGDDLSVYAKYSWASYESLRACADDVGKRCHGLTFGDGSEDGKRQRTVWKRIDSLYRSGDFLGWQEAWGGIFVLALRTLAVRFISVAVYLLQTKNETSSEEKILLSELCESLGIILYSDLMGSQNYGYPMRPMGLRRKRDIASTARTCFQAAIDLVVKPKSDDDESDDDHATWDLLFMVGKCDEKIAGTYKLQSYSGQGDIRLYEKFMGSALDQYASAYAQAKKIEEDGGFIVDQSGGSAHGCTEMLYRIHASRLKCLISGATRAEKELQHSEEEALRLTERHWFKAPENLEASKAEHTRDRIWNVLSDVVSGLAQCRVDQTFFHRSVYRHAQALMWSPLLYDPTSSEGSLDSVPATRSFQIRGLNNSTPAVHSAEIIMSALFDKKRPQLCAVWVTTTSSSSPFQVLNNSTRKYDSLRGKYIAAYLETLRLSRRRGKLEAFVKSASACRRDLPSYFQASALAGGGVPSKIHCNEPLLRIHNSLRENGFLVTVKRQANSAFADVLIYEMSERSAKASSTEEQKQSESYLKYAYASYLRLHCARDDLNKVRAWKYGTDSIREVEAVCQAYLALDDELGDAAGKADYGDWSGGGRKAIIFDKALAKCKGLFPTLSGAFFSKKATASAKAKKGSKEEGEGGEKRKEPDGGPAASTGAATMSFEVAVPVGLSAGDSFLTSVKVGGATKKLKLTVPKSNPSTLRFHVPVSKEDTPVGESMTKKPRTTEDSPESGKSTGNEKI